MCTISFLIKKRRKVKRKWETKPTNFRKRPVYFATFFNINYSYCLGYGILKFEMDVFHELTILKQNNKRRISQLDIINKREIDFILNAS